MKILHLLASGGTGGIEKLCNEYGISSKNDNIFCFVWNGGKTANEMKNANLNVIDLNLSKANILGLWEEFNRLCKNEKIGVIVEHHSAPILHLLLMLLKKKFQYLKIIAYAHCDAKDMQGGNRSKAVVFKKMIIKKFFQNADKIIAISNFVSDSLVEQFGVSKDKITIVYNGIDIKKMTGIVHKKHNPIEIVYVGRLVEQKGVQVILRALCCLSAKDDWHFSIIGDGDYKFELENKVKNLHLTDKVSFLGNCSNISELLAKSDIFVHAPLWEEGFGITIIEAMASGLLCIVAKSGATVEIIDNQVNGYLFEKGSEYELAEKISTCIDEYDSAVNKNIRLNAKKTADLFTIESFSNRLDEILCE